MNINAAFEWKCQPQAERLILDAVEKGIQSNSELRQLSENLFVQTSTRLFDWLDHVILEDSLQLRQELEKAGFVRDRDEKEVYYHPGAQLPKIVLKGTNETLGMAVLVDCIADFLMVRGVDRVIEGSLFGNFRRCRYNLENNHALWLVERRGTAGMTPTEENSDSLLAYHQALEEWQTRPRLLENEVADLEKALGIARKLVASVGQTRAAWTVLEVERRYWQARNRAAKMQKSRQDDLGMGWSNHDHHTFRSSRRNFCKLVQLFEILGFRCRERFYAGEEAGWGAQVMEHPICRFVLFLDVDLAPHEIIKDFAYQELKDLDYLGTVGLWCALHGDSIQHAGMHHLEAQFMFDNLSEDLAKHGVNMMNPFSTFPYLRQAFTQGEMWKVDSKRVRNLVESGLITQEQAEKFLSHGALGSHLENLQRREGYKGFNQKNVSIIIQETDPRKID
jgi:hypothetical protein